MARACGACAGAGTTCASDGFATCATCEGAGRAREGDDSRLDDDDDFDFHGAFDRDDGTRGVADALANLPLVDARGRAVKRAPREVLVACFTRDDCGACRAFAPRLARLATERRDALDVVAIACEEKNGCGCVDEAAEASGAPDETLRVSDAREGDPEYSRARETNFVLRALGAATLPTVAIVHRGARRVITTWGRAAMYVRGDDAVECWRRGESGLNPFAEAARDATRALATCGRVGGRRRGAR